MTLCALDPRCIHATPWGMHRAAKTVQPAQRSNSIHIQDGACWLGASESTRFAGYYSRVSLSGSGQSDDEFPDVVWDFTSSELELADPPPGGWHLSDTEDTEEDEPQPQPPIATAFNSAVSNLGCGSETRGVEMSARTLLTRAGRSAMPPMELRPSWKRNGFTVSDLVSVAWCELQIDYGLRQKRHERPADRPSSFVSREGKTIVVKQQVAVENAERQDRGTKVHEKLEREIHPVKVIVHATNKEESWAKRLVNMLTALVALKTMGACREMPVFGYVQEEIIVGIIDEIVRRPCADKSSNKTKVQKDPSQSTLDSFISPSKAKGRLPSEDPVHKLFVLDNKTRATNTLPPRSASFSAKMQLMLYHRLLTGLLFPSSSTAPIDPAAVFTKVGVDPSLPFTPNFVTEINVPLASNGLPPVFTLNELSELWYAALQDLHRTTQGVDTKLEIVYRFRDRTRRERQALGDSSTNKEGKRKRKTWAQESGDSESSAAGSGRRKRPSAEHHSSLQDSAALGYQDPNFAHAIALSLNAPSLPDNDTDLQLAIAASLKDQRTARPEEHAGSQSVTSQDVGGTPNAAAIHDEEIVLHEVISGGSEDAAPLPLPNPLPSTPPHPPAKISVEEAVPTSDQEAGMDSTATRLDQTAQAEVPSASVLTSIDEASADTRGPETLVTDSPYPQRADMDEDIVMGSDTESDTSSISTGFADQAKGVGPLSRTFSDTAIIGIRRFGYDRAALDEFLERSLGYWRGTREPEGVAIEDAARCLSCEYMDDCEWRAKKAEEFLTAAIAKRNGKPSAVQ